MKGLFILFFEIRFFFSYFNFYLKTSKKLVYVPFKIFDIQRLFFFFFTFKAVG